MLYHNTNVFFARQQRALQSHFTVSCNFPNSWTCIRRGCYELIFRPKYCKNWPSLTQKRKHWNFASLVSITSSVSNALSMFVIVTGIHTGIGIPVSVLSVIICSKICLHNALIFQTPASLSHIPKVKNRATSKCVYCLSCSWQNLQRAVANSTKTVHLTWCLRQLRLQRESNL